MTFWLLDADISGRHGVATPIGISQASFRGDPETRIFWEPRNQYEDLLQTGRRAAALALQILTRERGVRGCLEVTFSIAGPPRNIIGPSAGLLLTLAIITEYLRTRQLAGPFPNIAATGEIDGEDGGRSSGFVREVGAVPAKIAAALTAAGCDAPAIVFFPETNSQELRRAGIVPTENVRLVAVSHIDEALEALGIPLKLIYLRNPFRGLEYFDYQHQPIFFGREREIGEVLERLLHREALGSPGLLIDGASGSGKSSFIRAGVLPVLADPSFQTSKVKIAITAKPFSRDLRPAIWRASVVSARGSELQIVQSIARCWGELADFPTGVLLRAQSLAELVQRRRHHWPALRRFAWMIDQLEELFNLGFDTSTIDAFGQFLLDLQVDGVWTLASMRDDAFSRFKRHASFRQAFGEDGGSYYLSTLGVTELAAVITRPAQAAGVTFEIDAKAGSLDNVILRDALGQQESLPLLEFTLQQLYESSRSGELTFDAYRGLGGLKGSITRRADEAIAGLETNLGDVLLGALSRLIRVQMETTSNQAASYSRAPARWEDFSTEEQSLLERLIAKRLLVRARALNPVGTSVELAHEALVTHWEPLRAWIATNAKRLRWRQEVLSPNYALWTKRGHDPVNLLPRHLACEAESLFGANGLGLSYTENEYVQASLANHRKRHQQTLIAYSLVTLLIIILVLVASTRIHRKETIATGEKSLSVANDLLSVPSTRSDGIAALSTLSRQNGAAGDRARQTLRYVLLKQQNLHSGYHDGLFINPRDYNADAEFVLHHQLRLVPHKRQAWVLGRSEVIVRYFPPDLTVRRYSADSVERPVDIAHAPTLRLTSDRKWVRGYREKSVVGNDLQFAGGLSNDIYAFRFMKDRESTTALLFLNVRTLEAVRVDVDALWAAVPWCVDDSSGLTLVQQLTKHHDKVYTQISGFVLDRDFTGPLAALVEHGLRFSDPLPSPDASQPDLAQVDEDQMRHSDFLFSSQCDRKEQLPESPMNTYHGWGSGDWLYKADGEARHPYTIWGDSQGDGPYTWTHSLTFTNNVVVHDGDRPNVPLHKTSTAETSAVRAALIRTFSEHREPFAKLEKAERVSFFDEAMQANSEGYDLASAAHHSLNKYEQFVERFLDDSHIHLSEAATNGQRLIVINTPSGLANEADMLICRGNIDVGRLECEMQIPSVARFGPDDGLALGNERQTALLEAQDGGLLLFNIPNHSWVKIFPNQKFEEMVSDYWNAEYIIRQADNLYLGSLPHAGENPTPPVWIGTVRALDDDPNPKYPPLTLVGPCLMISIGKTLACHDTLNRSIKWRQTLDFDVDDDALIVPFRDTGIFAVRSRDGAQVAILNIDGGIIASGRIGESIGGSDFDIRDYPDRREMWFDVRGSLWMQMCSASGPLAGVPPICIQINTPPPLSPQKVREVIDAVH